MARCGCGNQTCSCIITAGDGVIVSGLGTPTRPYEISLTTAGAGLSESIKATPTETLKLYTNGAGTPDNPLNIYGNATVKMTDVTDVADPEGPASGDVVTFVTDHWEFRPPAAAPPGSVNVSNPLSGDGSVGTPLGLKTSGFWPLPGFPLSQLGTSGSEIYVDSAGQVRTKPQLITVAKPVTDLASTYPFGVTVMAVDATTGAAYPPAAACTVITQRRSDGPALQWCATSSSGTATQIWARAGTSTAWAGWVSVAEDTGWVNLTPSSGTGTFQYRCHNGVVSLRASLGSITSLPAGQTSQLLAGGVIPAAYRPTVSVYAGGNGGGASTILGVVNAPDAAISWWNTWTAAVTVARFTANWLKE
jgi:hypothetical protein